MHRKKRPESELWLWAKIVAIPAVLVVYWSLLFISTAAGNAWTIWAVCGSYALLVAWLYSVYRVLHLAAWKRDRAIAEELAEQTGPFEPQWEDIGLTEERFVGTGNLAGTGKLYVSRVTEPITTHLESPISEATAKYWMGLRERLVGDSGHIVGKLDTDGARLFEIEQVADLGPHRFSCGEPALLTHDELYGGRHERTEIAPVQSFFPDHAPELPKADG